MLLSVVLNVPKFMESNFTWTPITSYGNNGSTNSSESSIIEYEIGFEVSELREHPDYIKYYTMWTRLITTGIIPLGALIYFNFGIFRGIQVRPMSDFSTGFINDFLSGFKTFTMSLGNFKRKSS